MAAAAAVAAGWAPRVGETVFVPSISSTARVVAVRGGQLTLQAGLMKLQAKVDEVQKR